MLNAGASEAPPGGRIDALIYGTTVVVLPITTELSYRISRGSGPPQ